MYFATAHRNQKKLVNDLHKKRLNELWHVELIASRSGNGLATSLEKQITVGGKKSWNEHQFHELENEALPCLPLGELMTS